MKQQQDRPLPLVEGEVIKDSLIKIIGLMAACLFFLVPVGAGLAWAWWTEASFANRVISWYGGGLGVVLFLVGVLGVAGSVATIFQRESIILGKECLQCVKGEKKVTTQIPYQNIQQLELVNDPESADLVKHFIGIDLSDAADANTYCPTLEECKRLHDWHFRLPDGAWVMPLSQIHDKIIKRLGTK